jgi:hypothetical protein
VSPLQAENVLRQRYQKFLGLSAQLQQTTALTATIAHQLAVRSAQFDRFMGSFSPPVYRRLTRQARRRDEIYRHVSQHLRAVQKMCETREEEAKKATDELRDLIERDKSMNEHIAKMAEWIGLDEAASLDEMERKVRQIRSDEDERDLERMF